MNWVARYRELFNYKLTDIINFYESMMINVNIIMAAGCTSCVLSLSLSLSLSPKLN